LITSKDVLDFGCGDGPLTIYLAQKHPHSIIGVDLKPDAIERARKNAQGTMAAFVVGSESGIPLPHCSIDTIVAFDMMEHVMAPQPIMREWFRVLRPGGRVVLEWFPFKGAWGPHMEALIPIPWAHVIFGERAMYEAAAEIYDLPEFMPRHWDLDQHGNKLPNKWRQWSSFREHGYVNELDIPTFKKLAKEVGFEIARFERVGFSGAAWRQMIGKGLMRLPAIGDYFCVSTRVELIRPELFWQRSMPEL
jgi:SAM-dependent methyltransferase